MSQYDDDDDFDSTGPKALRDQLAKIKKDLADAQKELTKANEEKADLQTKVKSSTLRDALSDQGIDPKYARLAERDGAEPTPEGIKAWVKENEDVYAFLQKPDRAPEVDDGEQDDGDEADEDGFDPDLEQEIRLGQQTESTGRPSGSSTVLQALEQAGADLSRFKSGDEVDAFLRSLGAPSKSDL